MKQTQYNSQYIQGTALITSLVLLLALTIVALAGMHTTTAQLLISSNDEATIEAHEYAQSVIDEIIETPSVFDVGTSDGYTVCTSGETGCNDTSMTLSSSMFSGPVVGTGIKARIELLKVATAPRLYSGNSASVTQGAYFSISGKYDETSSGKGKASIVQGYVILLPNGQ